MREVPSIVPAATDDYYIVVNQYGQHGTAFAETDLRRANYENTIADLMSGQHDDPLRVIMFNPEINRSEDGGRGTETENPRRFPSALTVFDKPDRPLPKVLRVSLRHRATSQLLSKQSESDLRPFGNPPYCSDSHQPKTALAKYSSYSPQQARGRG